MDIPFFFTVPFEPRAFIERSVRLYPAMYRAKVGLTGYPIHFSASEVIAFDRSEAKRPGQSRRGNILDTTPEDVDTLIDVNLRAVLHLTRLIAPGMASRDRGHIVNVSSIAGHYAFGVNATTFNSSVAYHATKAGIHSLSQQLRVDLYGTRVRVTEVSPGRVATNIFQNPNVADSESARFVGQFETLQPQDIVDAIAFAVESPARMNVAMLEVVPTFQVVGGLRFASRSGTTPGHGARDGRHR